VRFVRRLIVAVVGGTVVAVGAAMIVLPGPAVVVIPAGLAILATEFVWARRLLKRVKDTAGAIVPRTRTSPPKRERDSGSAGTQPDSR
jgi:tellurite resistance protein TerC